MSKPLRWQALLILRPNPLVPLDSDVAVQCYVRDPRGDEGVALLEVCN